MIMRTIRLTHDEIEIIKKSLSYVYNEQIAFLEKNRNILTETAFSEILENAKTFNEAESVFDGERDV